MATQKLPAILRPIQVGRLALKHHIVLAPLTRVRNSSEGVPNQLVHVYYSQRATNGGLLISEATVIAKEAGGMANIPGIYSKEQIAAWRQVTDAVHAKGGYIFSQLWALGRIANPNVVDKVVGPSDDIFKANPDAAGNEVTALTETDIDRYVNHYAQAAKNAIEAGFDGVEIHGANGYLVDQFLQSVSNHRTDSYGGSIENRARFALRVLGAVVDVVGADRVGIRISPFTQFQGMKEADPFATFVPYAELIAKAHPNLAYVHAVEPRVNGVIDIEAPANESLDPIREVVVRGGRTRFIVAGGYKPADAEAHVEQFPDDLVAFGRYFISNPDLVQRTLENWELTPYNRQTFYSSGAEGYIDYKTYLEEHPGTPSSWSRPDTTSAAAVAA